MAGLHNFAVAGDGGALQGVAQLANISRPVVVLKSLHYFVGDHGRFALVFTAHIGQQVFDQFRQVFFMVAASTRTSTVVSTLLPKRRSLWSSSTRSSLAWVFTGISPISSSSSVPSSASSKQPALRSSAPVKAPFSCPKISLSMRVSGIAEQLMARNGLVLRGLKL